MVPGLRGEFGGGRLWIDGSRARGDSRRNSDLDLVVQFERRGISLITFCRMERLLTEALGVKVDLAEEGAMPSRVAESIAEDAIAV